MGDGILEEFRVDFQEFWRQWPRKGFFLVLLAAWVALFHFVGNPTLGYVKSASLFRWMLDAYDPHGRYLTTDDGHGVLVPFVVLGLFWWKRKELMAVPNRSWWPGVGITTFALALHVAAYMVQQPKVSIVAFFLGLYGLMGMAWGPHFLKASFFPFFLFIFCVPLGTQGAAITTPLRHLVAIIVTGIAHLGLAPSLVREGTLLIDGENSFRYDIAPACSGIRSLVTLLALTTVFGFISFKTTWKRWLMVFLAFPLAILGNVIRLTLTVGVAEALGHDWGKAVEQNLGFITFAVAIAVILLMEYWLRDREPKASNEPVTGGVA